MNKLGKWFVSFSVILLIALFAWICINFFCQLDEDLPQISPTQKAMESKLAKENAGRKNLRIDLEGPGEAPKQIKHLVERGYHLMLHTHEELPEHAPHLINCTHCHFAGGITTGDMGGGISLAGVAAIYPKLVASRSRIEDLPMRINDCFYYSLNGKPLPLDSEDMLAMVTYLHWISAGTPVYQTMPWLGLPPLHLKHQLNTPKGQQIYKAKCSGCHGQNGEGTGIMENFPRIFIPPLWGSESFNRQAGLGKIEKLSSFIYHNMPYEEPHLTKEEALDVAAFILKQPRPDYGKENR